jgi:hypothetical protein
MAGQTAILVAGNASDKLNGSASDKVNIFVGMGASVKLKIFVGMTRAFAFPLFPLFPDDFTDDFPDADFPPDDDFPDDDFPFFPPLFFLRFLFFSGLLEAWAKSFPRTLYWTADPQATTGVEIELVVGDFRFFFFFLSILVPSAACCANSSIVT